jgi:hypothetical protein
VLYLLAAAAPVKGVRVGVKVAELFARELSVGGGGGGAGTVSTAEVETGGGGGAGADEVEAGAGITGVDWAGAGEVETGGAGADEVETDGAGADEVETEGAGADDVGEDGAEELADELAPEDPRQYTFPSRSDRYALPSPNAGRWNLLHPPVTGSGIGVRTPPSGTALNARSPATRSQTHRIPVPSLPLKEVIVGAPRA